MKKLLVISALFFLTACCEARAGDTLYWSTGTGCAMKLTGLEAPVAVLECRNRVTGGHDKITSGQLDAGGIVVDLTVSHGDSLADPDDIFYATPQEGYYAVPPTLWLGEEKEGVIEIYKLEGLILG